MKKKRFTEQQIIGFLKEAEAGVQVKELCRKHGFSDAAFYGWRAKFGGLQVSEAKRLRELEAENAKLKKLLAEAHLDVEAPAGDGAGVEVGEQGEGRDGLGPRRTACRALFPTAARVATAAPVGPGAGPEIAFCRPGDVLTLILTKNSSYRSVNLSGSGQDTH